MTARQSPNSLLDTHEKPVMSTTFINPYRFGENYRSAVLADSPVRYWRVGEASGTNAVDETGNDDATYVNSPTLGESGIVTQNDAVLLDGVDQYIETDTLDDFGSDMSSGDWSIEYWLKTTESGEGRPLGCLNASGATGLQLINGFDKSASLSAGDILIFLRNQTGSIYQEEVSIGSDLYDGDWHHYVWTHAASATVVKMYFDGSEQTLTTGSTLPSGAYSNFNDPMYFGVTQASGSPAGTYIDGTMDEIGIYTTELSSARIQAHYNAANNI